MKKAILALLLVVSIVLSDSRAFGQDETTTTVEDLTTTTVETTTTTVAEPPAETTQEATTSTTTTTTTVKPRVYPRLPSLRVGSSRHCRRGINACFIARYHQNRHGHYLWRRGRVYQKPNGQLVRGSRSHTWVRMRREARQLVRYLRAVSRRGDLVRRWSGVARCESNGRWNIATGNGYYGGLQFSLGTWRAYGGRGYPHHQPAWYQAQIADNVRRRSGLHHWPHCGRYY